VLARASLGKESPVKNAAKISSKPVKGNEQFSTEPLRSEQEFTPPKFSWSIGNVSVLAPRDGESDPCDHSGPAPARRRLAQLPWPIQAKLEIGAVDDPLERQADHVAEQAMRMPEPLPSSNPQRIDLVSELHTAYPPTSESPATVQRKCSCGGNCEKCKSEQYDEEDGKVQRKPDAPPISTVASSPVSPRMSAPPIVHDVLRSSGQPLDAETRAFFEPRFGYDFSRVRVHADEQAAESAHAVGAHAYTVGPHIAFSTGHYSPRSAWGQQLLAHELTHVIQQASIQNNGPTEFAIQKTSGNRLLRRIARESTVQICHRVLKSKNIEVSQGGVRVVLLLRPLDKEVPDCHNHKFWVSLTKPGLLFDSDIAECEGETGEDKASFLFGNIPSGTYYVTIHRVFDHPYCCIEGDILIFDEKISKDSSGCERRKSLSTMDIVHGALDIAGFIPVLGAIPDGVNAVIYAAEGDWANAGLSAIAMIPAWGDGVKLAEMGGKTVIKMSEKAAFRMGEEGIAKGLKEVKAASKVEKATIEAEAKAEKAIGKAEQGAAEEAGKAEKAIGKTEKETAEEAAKAEKKEAEEAAKAEKKEKKGGKWTCYGRSAVLQIPSALPEFKCPLDGQYINGLPVSGPTEAAACLAAKHAFTAMMPRGCKPKHLACRCSKR
jgi:hypothetical protein